MSEAQPDWLKNYQEQEKHPPRGGYKGWKPGQSGNPKGRPRGSKNKRTPVAQKFSHAIEKQSAQIVRVLIDKALAGDSQALGLAVNRLYPPLRARSKPVHFPLDPDAPLTDQAKQVMAATAEGKLSPDDGKMLLDCIAGLATIKSVDELEARIEALESGKGSAPAPRGQIATYDMTEATK